MVGRPLAALLANDGARVFSVDIDSIQEYTKRPQIETAQARRHYPHHVVHACSKTLQECLAISDVVITAVPSASYKVKTEWLKDGCVCVNVSSEKNFEKDVREKVRDFMSSRCRYSFDETSGYIAGVHIHPCSRESNHPYAAAQSVSRSYSRATHLAIMLSKLRFRRLRLRHYQEVLRNTPE